MRFSLINPNWNFENSIYFGCRDPHLPLEFGYSKALLDRDGHEAQIVDAHMDNLSVSDIREHLDWFRPHFTILTTAPTYLFWRCPPPELRIPQALAESIRDYSGMLIAVGPHGSTTPQAALSKLGADAVVMGECEDIVPRLAATWDRVDSLCYRSGSEIRKQGSTHAADMAALPALRWSAETLARHHHHHHRFDTAPEGPGAEMETSRGCPYHCTFCAKDNFRNSFRRRPMPVIAEELDNLISAGAKYIYFVDELFLPFRDTLETIAARGVKFGIQTRIDLWSEPMLDLLGEAGCVSIEAGVESITPEGREMLDKKCRMSTEQITDRLLYAKKRVPFVQANLLDSAHDLPSEVENWRSHLMSCGVWANKPVPMFPYPGSPDYTQRWGAADDLAWERAHDFYLNRFQHFSDIQEPNPAPLVQLEGGRAQ